MKPAFSLLPIFVILMVSTVAIACDEGAAVSPEQENTGEVPNAASEKLVLEIKEGGYLISGPGLWAQWKWAIFPP